MPLFARHAREVRAQFPEIGERRMVNETVRRMINALIVDLASESARRIAAAQPASIEDVRQAGPLVAFSPEVRKEADALKSFLLHNLYRHFRVMRMTTKAKRIVTELFRGLPRRAAAASARPPGPRGRGPARARSPTTSPA